MKFAEKFAGNFPKNRPAMIKKFTPNPLCRTSSPTNATIPYASWDPKLELPFFRSSARAPTIKAIRGTVAIKGIFDT